MALILSSFSVAGLSPGAAMKRRIAIAIVTTALLGGAPVASAGPERVEFPAGYQQNFLRFGEVDRPDRKPQQVRLFYVDPASAAAATAGQPVPNGAVLTQRVESMQERRFRNVVRQHTDYSCGAAALATILRYAYHLEADEGTVIEGMMGVSDPQLVHQRGLRAEAQRTVDHAVGQAVAAGTVLAQQAQGPGVVLAELDPARLRSVRQQLPALAHRIL